MRFFLPAFFLVFVCCSEQNEIDFQQKGQLYFNLKINDSINGNFMFDTGAKGLAFDSSFYFSQGFSKTKLGNSKLAGAGTDLQDIILLNDSVSVSVSSCTKTMCWPIIFNCKRIFGKACDGILGWNFFNEEILIIDYDRGKLVFSDKTIDLSSFRKIPFQFIEDKIIIKATLLIGNVTVKGDFFLDTGFDGTVALTSKTVSHYNLQYIEEKKPFYKRNGGIGGDLHGFNTVADSLSYEGFGLKNVPLLCLQNESGGLAQPHYAGNIGNNVLKRFIVGFDFRSQALYLKPGNQFISAF